MSSQLLIYKTAVPVNNARHAGWSIETGGDYSFGRNINSVPLMAVEIPQAASEYAIVFAGDENNTIYNTHPSASQGDGIEIKRGSHSNIIRNNIIHDTSFPCILLYGTEGNPRNIVEQNVMWNCGDSGIQAAADAIIRNNVIFPKNSANGFNSQSHQGVSPNNLEFVHNTVIGGNPCLRLSGWGDKQGMQLTNNAIYCESDNFKIITTTRGGVTSSCQRIVTHDS